MACASRQNTLLNFLPILPRPSMCHSLLSALTRASARCVRAIHRPAGKTYELSSRLMEYTCTRTMDSRDRTASPFNYLASYSISEARRVDVHDEEAINAEAATPISVIGAASLARVTRGIKRRIRSSLSIRGEKREDHSLVRNKPREAFKGLLRFSSRNRTREKRKPNVNNMRRQTHEQRKVVTRRRIDEPFPYGFLAPSSERSENRTVRRAARIFRISLPRNGIANHFHVFKHWESETWRECSQSP